MALGANLGARRATLDRVAGELNRLPHTRLLRRSRWIDTPPEAAGDGPRYLNGAALLVTGLDADALLTELQALERRWGRDRRQRPRLLDLDLIVYGQQRREDPWLELPHPRFRGRPFVLEPAAEVAPRLRDPVTGRTLLELSLR